MTPGAVLASVIWLAASLGFKYYVTNFGTYSETYGALGGVMVLLLWFYLSGVVFLLGAELNAEIEHASPYGKAVGEKVPGAKRAIGALGYRRYLERPAPVPRPQPCPAPPQRRPPRRGSCGACSWRWSPRSLSSAGARVKAAARDFDSDSGRHPRRSSKSDMREVPA